VHWGKVYLVNLLTEHASMSSNVYGIKKKSKINIPKDLASYTTVGYRLRFFVVAIERSYHLASG